VGQILFGIERQCPFDGLATVRGLVCNQEKRDRFRVRFTNLLADRIKPSVAAGTVTIHFWPMTDMNSGLPVDQLFIVGMLMCICYIFSVG